MPPTQKTTPLRPVQAWLRHGTKRLNTANLCFDNGLQNAAAEAEYLLFHCLGLPFEEAERHLTRPVAAAVATAYEQLLERRILERIPVHYLTHEAFFAGMRLYVDPRVLIPRSRIEILLDDPEGLPVLAPAAQVGRILDLCTGSGCLAFALATLYPKAAVDAADLSPEALAVARLNRKRLGLGQRVRLVQSDLFAALGRNRYDLIVTNPPYVTHATLAALPAEYHHEPTLALDGGDNGLQLVLAILQQAPAHLTPHGLLICEVGDETEAILRRNHPRLPLAWLPFHFGGSGVFAATRADLS